MTKQDGKRSKGNQPQGKSYLERRVDAVINQPYKRTNSWMEEIDEELDDLLDATRSNPNISWEEAMEASAS